MDIVPLSVLSLEYCRVQVKAYEAGVAVNPTGLTVQMAFPVHGVDPVSGDWKAATWETAGGNYYARCRVGPGGAVTLPIGSYDVWVKVFDATETPVKTAGRIAIV